MADHAQTPDPLKSMWKSILIGGTAAGILSLIPIINLLNLFFMLWMALGGAVTVYLLIQANKPARQIKAGDALLSGALSGVWGCILFGIFAYTTLSRIPPEKIERVASLARNFFPDMEEEIASLFQPDTLRTLALIVMALAMLFSIISGAVGGIISRSIFKNREDDEK